MASERGTEARSQLIEPLPAGISIIVPVFNSETTLEPLVQRLQPVLRSLADQFEVILVNDGSRDKSWNTIERLCMQYPFVVGINLMRNYGQHNALLCGIRTARFDTTVTMDDDLQHPPEEIPKLLSKLREGFDVVYGTPMKMEHSIARNILSRLTKIGMSLAVGTRVIAEINAFRALRTDLRRSFDDFQAPHLLFDALLGWGTTRFGSVRVMHEARKVGRSNYTFAKLFNQVLLLLTGYSTAPLRFGSIVGFIFTLLGATLLVYVLVVRFIYGSPLGFAFQVSVLALSGGAQLFILGIMGEYLARIFNRSMDRPTYIVRDAVGLGGGGERGIS